MLSRDPMPAGPGSAAADAGRGLAASGGQCGGWPVVPASAGSSAQPPGSARPRAGAALACGRLARRPRRV